MNTWEDIVGVVFIFAGLTVLLMITQEKVMEIDKDIFILDTTHDKRVASLRIDRNIEIYSVSKGRFKVVEWEHQYCNRKYFDSLSDAIQYCMNIKRIYDRTKLKYSHKYGGVSMQVNNYCINLPTSCRA